MSPQLSCYGSSLLLYSMHDRFVELAPLKVKEALKEALPESKFTSEFRKLFLYVPALL